MNKTKKSRKAERGGRPKWINLLRNWTHQAVTYMSAGELIFRIIVEAIEFSLLILLLLYLKLGFSLYQLMLISFVVVHTWNWVSNGLFWAVIIFAFPNKENPGAVKTVEYLNMMRNRLLKSESIVGVAIYGSVSRNSWHIRSDIDIRFLRKPGFFSLIASGLITMRERFYAFVKKQPMDLFLADDIQFLKKMRADEVPILTICKDKHLSILYPGCVAREIIITDLIGHDKKGIIE